MRWEPPCGDRKHEMPLTTVARYVKRCQALQPTPAMRAATAAWFDQVQQCPQLMNSYYADTVAKIFAHEVL
jgi:hypothetical protein